jgi:hypothetical protein
MITDVQVILADKGWFVFIDIHTEPHPVKFVLKHLHSPYRGFARWHDQVKAAMIDGRAIESHSPEELNSFSCKNILLYYLAIVLHLYIWNTLPTELKHISSRLSFSHSLTSYKFL